MARWCGVIVQPAKLKALVGSESAVEPVIGLYDEVLTPVMQAICAEVLRGGITGRQLRLVADHVDAQIDREISAAQLAQLVGLSEAHFALDCSFTDQAHFARSFSQHYGSSPSALRKSFI